MSGNLIILTGLIYTYVAVELWLKGQQGLAVAYAGYAFSNVGLYIATK